jgi:hypothetical protein
MLESVEPVNSRALMTYFKCTSCKAHLYSLASLDGPARDLCPGCGTMLEPVGELVEVVGYHSICDRSLGVALPFIRAAATEGLGG